MTIAQDRVSFIGSIAELFRGDYKQADYGRVILPFTVLRRLDCVLEPTKEAALGKAANLRGDKLGGNEDSEWLRGKPDHLAANLKSYIRHFSSRARDNLLGHFRLDEQIQKPDQANLPFTERLRNHDMGQIFEELIRRFSEQSNETAGEHFTPRGVIKLVFNVLFVQCDEALAKTGVVGSLCYPACGNGGMPPKK
jgi:type I restriction enzyme M protein